MVGGDYTIAERCSGFSRGKQRARRRDVGSHRIYDCSPVRAQCEASEIPI